MREVVKVLVGVVAQLGVKAVVHRIGAHAGQHQGVTVRSRFGRALGADGAACAADVLHNHGLFECFPKFISDQAPHDIAGAADRKGNYQFEGLVGVIGLSRCLKR